MTKKKHQPVSKADVGKPAKSAKPPSKSTKSASEAPLPEIISETIVEYLHEVEGESPIDLEWENFIKIRTVPIEWMNYEEVPMTLSLKNTAYNVVLTATWPDGKTPYVCKGPLAAKYEFAQVHFHWGTDNKEGSDHSVEGCCLPFEVHLVFFKATAGSISEAKKEEDGIVAFCYLYKMQESDNDELKLITDHIKDVTLAYNKKDLSPVALRSLFDPISEDYVVYLGFMKYKAVHGVAFIISRDTHFIGEAQLSVFRGLKDRHENPMILKKREIHGFNGRNVFVVNPRTTIVTTVLHTLNKRSKVSYYSQTSSKHSPSREKNSKDRSTSKGHSGSKNRNGSKHRNSSKNRNGSKNRNSLKNRSPSGKRSSSNRKRASSKKRPRSKK